MITTLVLASLLAENAAGKVQQNTESNRIVVPVPNATMSCTKEGDHLVCVVPLPKEAADEPLLSSSPPPKAARPYRRSPTTQALPDPQVLKQLQVAEENIELAKSLLPKATTPEQAVLAQQLLYWAKKQYSTSEALLHSAQDDLLHAPDPFDRQSLKDNAQSM